MGNLVVVVGQPFLGLLADLGEIAETAWPRPVDTSTCRLRRSKAGRGWWACMENTLRAIWRTLVRTTSGSRGICMLRRGHAEVAFAKIAVSAGQR